MSAAAAPSSSTTAAPAPLDPAVQEKVDLARTFASQLLKGIKQIGMYRHNEAKFPEFLQRAHEAIGQYTQKHGPLSFKVDQQNFLLVGQPLFEEASPLPYKFFRDGVRQLIFRPELGVDELVAFTKIALSEPERGGEDCLAQLWRAGFQNIEYVVVEGFKVGDSSEEEVQVEVDKIIGYLYGRLKTTSDDFLRFARVSTDDLDARVDGVDQIRGAVISGLTADDTLKAKLQKEIEEEEQSRLFPKVMSAVFQVMESGVEDPALLEEIFIQLLDAMLLQEDFATINQILLKLRALEQRHGDKFTQLRSTFQAKMGEEQRLTRIGEIFKSSRFKNPVDITRYLQALDAMSVPLLLAVLEGLETADNRQLLCDALAPFARDIPDPFVNRLSSERPQTVRDMVYILEKSKNPDRIKLFGIVMQHKNLAVRLEVLQIVARAKTAIARQLVVDALNDPSAQVRVLAARLLPEFDRDKAYADLMQLIRDPGFEKKSPEEKAGLYAALGSTGLPMALNHLVELVRAKTTLLHRKKITEDKILAIQGLASVASIQAYKVLQEAAEDKSNPTEVLTAARKALYQTKKALFGDAAPPDEGAS